MATKNNTIATLSLFNIHEKGYDFLLNILQVSPGECSVAYLCDLYCHHHIDVALGELERAFIGEILSNYAFSIEYVEKAYSFNIKYSDNNFSKVLYWLSGLFFCDEDEYSDEYLNVIEDFSLTYVREEFYQFEGDIFEEKISPKFPSMVDNYFANMVADENTWYDSKKILDEHPEWAFHTWRSACSSKLGFDLYVSPVYWLLEKSSSISKALTTASFLNEKDYEFQKVKSVYSDLFQIFIFTENEVICLSQETHFKAVRCAEKLFPVDDEPQFNTQYDWYSQGYFSLTNNNSVLKWSGSTYQYIIFGDRFTVLNHNSLRHMTKQTQAIINMLLDYSNESLLYKCEWNKLDDELFEQLCYHLVVRDGRFSADHTKKMGHSRSRDGGRDIITETVRRAGDRGPSVWIMQCKFSLQKKSLGRNDVSPSELIDEYSPSGIIVATNTLVDSGTYDKYERISKNRGIAIDVWDGLRIERELNKNPDVFKRFFK